MTLRNDDRVFSFQVISEYCRTRLQTKPFTHIVTDMYQEVVSSPQYAARKRAAYYQLNAYCPTRNIVDQSNHQKMYSYPQHHQSQWQQQQDHVQATNGQPTIFFQHHQTRVEQHSSDDQRHQQQDQPTGNQFRAFQQHQDHALQPPPKGQQDHHQHHHPHHHHHHNRRNHHHAKESLFRAQSRNSQSHPNLASLCGLQQQQQQQHHRHHQEAALGVCRRTQFQSQLDIQNGSRSIGPSTVHHQRRHHHSRTYSQPIYTRLQHTRSSGNLPTSNAAANDGNVCCDPIYALPVKPFLSSQDVRVNGMSAKIPAAIRRGDDIYGVSSSISR